MLWKIEFYDKKVEDSIKEWPESILAKFLWVVELIEKFGPSAIGMPHAKLMGQGIFEIRVKAIDGLGWAICCTVKGKTVIILNGFIKKTQKTPQSEIALAKQRMAEVKKRG